MYNISVPSQNGKDKIVKQLKDVHTLTKGKAKAAELVQGNNAFIGMLELDPNAAVPIHRDSTEEYLYLLSGSGTITIDGESFEIEEGTTVYMPSNAEVSYKNGNTITRLIQVFAGPKPASKYKSWKETTFKWQ